MSGVYPAPAISVQGVGLHTAVWWQGCHRLAVGHAGGWEGAQHQLLGLGATLGVDLHTAVIGDMDSIYVMVSTQDYGGCVCSD